MPICTNYRSNGRTRSENQNQPNYQALEPRQLLTTALLETSLASIDTARTHFESIPSREIPHEIVGNYRTDFWETPENNPWSLYWNAPSGWVPDAADQFNVPNEFGFRPLVNVGNQFQASRQGLGTDWPANYLFLDGDGGHVGAHAYGQNEQDRFAIVAMEVRESGFYSVVDSWISKYRTAGDGLEVRIWVDDGPVIKMAKTEPGEQFSVDFDVNLGFLNDGDQVFIAVGADGNHIADSFHWDFSVARFNAPVVADYQDDFGRSSQWSYHWNAPSNWAVTYPAVPRQLDGDGGIGDVSSYRRLLASGGVVTPDGNLDGTDRDPAGYLRLSRIGGMVGHAASELNPVDRYAIAAIEIQDSGYYAITDSLLEKTKTNGNAIELVIHDETGAVLFEDLVQPGGRLSFDQYLGFLKKGQTIFVGVGSHGDAMADQFRLDYSLVSEPMLRSSPLEDLVASHVIHVDDFGALPNDRIDDQPAIQAAINAAIKLRKQSGKPVVVKLGEGTYRLGVANGVNLSLPRTSQVVVEGAGQDKTQLLFTHHRSTAFRITDSRDLIFRDFSIDYEELAFTQGSIRNVIDDTRLVIQVDPGYRAPNDTTLFGHGLTTHRTQFLISDRTGRHANNEAFVLADLDSVVEISEGVFEVAYRKQLPGGLSAGDAWYQIARINEHANFAVFRNDGDITISNVTSFAGPSGFVQGQDNERLNVIDVRVDLKDGRLVSLLGDAVHASRNRDGVWVEGSTFVGLSDDIVNVYRLERDYGIQQLAPNRFAVNSTFDLHAEESVIFYREDGYRERARLVEVGESYMVTDRVIKGFDSQTRLAPLDHASRGSVIRDNLVERHRAGHGSMVVWSPDTTILGNQFYGINTHAVSTNAYEAVTLSDGLIVQGNVFDDVGFSEFLEVEDWAAVETGLNTTRNIITDNIFGALFGAAIEDSAIDTLLSDNVDFDGEAVVVFEGNSKLDQLDQLSSTMGGGLE